MIFLEYLFNLPNSTAGADQITVQMVNVIPSFTPLLLAFTFFLVFLGGIFAQKDRLGGADYAMWATVASLSTFMVTLILSGISGIIQLDWLIVVITITIFSGIWLFMSRERTGV